MSDFACLMGGVFLGCILVGWLMGGLQTLDLRFQHSLCRIRLDLASANKENEKLRELCRHRRDLVKEMLAGWNRDRQELAKFKGDKSPEDLVIEPAQEMLGEVGGLI